MYYDDEDEELVNSYTWGILKDPKKKTYYAKTHIMIDEKDKTVLIHRLLLNITHRNIQVDHINHNGLDNRRENLRLCTNSQNNMHTHSRRGSFSKYKGVSFDKHYLARPWMAEITINRKRIRLGYFPTEKEAAIAYNKAAIIYQGDFAVLNYIL
jgi:hypothetical protein